MSDNLKQNAGRLLKQDWPNATALAQELYAIVSDRIGDGLSAASPEAQSRKAGPKSLPPPPQPSPPPQSRARQDFPPGEIPTPVRPPRGIEQAPAQVFERPNGRQEFITKPRRLGMPPSIEQPTHSAFVDDVLFPDADWNLSVPGGSGSSVYNGIVVGGSGATPQVQLYPNGSQSDAGDTVEVNILQLASTETIPNGTWITGIQGYTDADGNTYYEAQLPVWLS